MSDPSQKRSHVILAGTLHDIPHTSVPLTAPCLPQSPGPGFSVMCRGPAAAAKANGIISPEGSGPSPRAAKVAKRTLETGATNPRCRCQLIDKAARARLCHDQEVPRAGQPSALSAPTPQILPKMKDHHTSMRRGWRLLPQVPGGPSITPAKRAPQFVQWPVSSRFHSDSRYQSRPITTCPQPVQ